MNKLLFLFSLSLLLGACGNDENASTTQESETEVSAPEGELDPTSPEEADEAEPATFAALANGEIPDGEPVSLTGTVEELTDDNAFPAFILTDGDQQVYVRNMAETAVAVGDTVTVQGIYEGQAEENMPLVSVDIIETP
ncbi:hypothetical protein [Planomicrobium sp. CPCC 101110]|uniref:hypothetical protein n=1 Tax=Planomicrobium sp. CPCC 101110 TaxID=2599619 RepID=UPI0011B5B96D|nr:hypothetical protein [Planomicrobium sp. CPCC 101110]TWT27398.1 hypothetical protein FQV30_02455 [Planomicrobium sp. CPCC 101110]